MPPELALSSAPAGVEAPPHPHSHAHPHALPRQQQAQAPTATNHDLTVETTDDEAFLPHPPTDEERDAYFGPQRRWIGPLSFVGYTLIVISIVFFVVRNMYAVWLLVPVAITTIGAIVSLFTSSRKRRYNLIDHRIRVANWEPDYVPSVDVFLPSAGEDLSVLENTYKYVERLAWHGERNIYVLDDSGRDEVHALALRHGFTYLSRPNRGEFKKAGNLRFGFGESAGDFILVLDADFVPRKDLFYELAPYFDDPDVAIVQSPQYFDIDKNMNWLQRAAGATQILFYRWVQPSRDKSNAAICVGTSALYRREALEKSGGYALIGHSEDVHTGVNLMKVGYSVRYVPTLVTKGLCPDTLDQFMTQQYRWCTGSMSLLFSKSFHAADLTFMQRLCYWSGFLYYITTAVNVFVMALPPILMAYFAPGRVSPANYAFVALALVVRQTTIPLITSGKESLFGLARIQTLYSFCHALALWDVLRGRTDSWVATGAKQKSRTSERVHKLIRRWCISVQVLLWGAIIWYVPLFGVFHFSLMILFAIFNLYVVYPLVKGWAGFPTMNDLPRFTRRQLGRARAALPGGRRRRPALAGVEADQRVLTGARAGE